MKVAESGPFIRVGNHSPARKNAAPADRRRHARGGPHPHAVSQACAAFYLTFVGLLRYVSDANERARLGAGESSGLVVTDTMTAAVDRRCIPADGVAPPLNMSTILGCRALSAGRLASLGASL